jgi:hypothetical protein
VVITNDILISQAYETLPVFCCRFNFLQCKRALAPEFAFEKAISIQRTFQLNAREIHVGKLNVVTTADCSRQKKNWENIFFSVSPIDKKILAPFQIQNSLMELRWNQTEYP